MGVLWLYIVLLNKSDRHPILITNNPRENLLSEAFRLNDIKLHRLVLLWIIFIFILILTSTLSLRCGHNLRIRLPTECPHYNRSSPEVNCWLILFRVRWCSHYEEMFKMASRYLVSMVDTCRLGTLRRRIWILKCCLPSFTEIISLRRRDLINIISYYYKNLYHYFTHVYIKSA